MSFFEPDVLIEAEQGLAASIGYGALSEDKFHAQLLTLDDLHGADEGRQPDFRFGLSIILRHI